MGRRKIEIKYLEKDRERMVSPIFDQGISFHLPKSPIRHLEIIYFSSFLTLSNLFQVSFQKRKLGLLKKAMELGILTDCFIVISIYNKE